MHSTGHVSVCVCRFEKWAELFGQTIYAVSAKATALTDLQTVRNWQISSFTHSPIDE